MEIKEINENFAKELITKSCDPMIDMAEISLDNIFNNDIITEIPVLKVIASLCKIGLNIRERNFAKNVINFINSFRIGQISDKEYGEFKTKMENATYRTKVTETIMICLDKFDDIPKSKILANLVIAFINEKISWDEFVMFSSMVNYLTSQDYETIKLLYEIPNHEAMSFAIHEKKYLAGSAFKLVQFSLVSFEVIHTMILGTFPATMLHKISENGIKFYESIM